MKKFLFLLFLPALTYAQSTGNVRNSYWNGATYVTGTWTGTGVAGISGGTPTTTGVSGTGTLGALAGVNTWTSTNTFNGPYSPLTVSQVSGTSQTYIEMVNPGADGNTTVKGRVGYVHSGTTAPTEHDNTHWRGMTLSFNERVNDVGTIVADDSSRSTYRFQLEYEYDGNAYPVTTITTGTTTRIQTTGLSGLGLLVATGGVAVDYVDGTAGAVLNNKRFTVVSAVNENDFIINANTNGLTATVTGSSCVFFPQNEWNVTSRNRRVFHMGHMISGAAIQGYAEFQMPFYVTVPDSWLSGSVGPFVVSALNGGIRLVSSSTTSYTTRIRLENSGTTPWEFGANSTNRFYIGDASNFYFGALNGRTILGAGPASDDGVTPVQLIGNSRVTGNFAVTGTYSNMVVSGTGSPSVVQITGEGNNNLWVRRSGIANGTGGTTVASFSASGTAAPTTFNDFLRILTNLASGTPNTAYLFCPTGVATLYVGINGTATSHEFGVNYYNGNLILSGTGSVTNPSYTTGSDANSGLFFLTGDNVGLTAGGVQIAGYHGSGFYLGPTASKMILSPSGAGTAVVRSGTLALTSEIPTVTSGTYTPTLTNVANVTASTAYECQYMRAGSTVTVSGKVDVDPTTTLTETQLGISLPIVSDLSAAEKCAGTANCPDIASQSAAILGDATNNRAQMEWQAADVTNQPMYFTFTYFIQ